MTCGYWCGGDVATGRLCKRWLHGRVILSHTAQGRIKATECCSQPWVPSRQIPREITPILDCPPCDTQLRQSPGSLMWKQRARKNGQVSPKYNPRPRCVPLNISIVPEVSCQWYLAAPALVCSTITTSECHSHITQWAFPASEFVMKLSYSRTNNQFLRPNNWLFKADLVSSGCLLSVVPSSIFLLPFFLGINWSLYSTYWCMQKIK